MTIMKIAVIAVTLWAATAASAFAQSGRRALDVLSQTASMAGTIPNNPRAAAGAVTVRAVVGGDSYEDYLVQYNRYRADYARYQAEVARENSTPGWLKVMQGASAGLQVANQAIGTYEHAVQANALTHAVGAANADRTGAALGNLTDFIAALR